MGNSGGGALALVTRMVADFFMTILWATIVSTTGYLLSLLSPVHQDDDTIEVVLILLIVICQVVMFAVLAELLGGASFNPLANISNFAAGEGKETLLTLLLRIPAQTAGMQIGAWLTWHFVVPHTHRHTLEGPVIKPGVNTAVGALTEFSLVLFLNTLVLYIFFGRPSSVGQKAAVLLPATLVAIMAGAAFTGPSMNPLFAFSWAYHHNRHTSLDHFLVYWIAPISGAVLAGLVFRWFLKPRPQKLTMEEITKKTT